jgi:methylmalonyl-CoA mutase N-terminal domain/subunit
MNTSMTINAPASWMLALYVALADERGDDRKKLRGTTQNDIVKEYLSRGTYVFPPEPSMKLISDMVIAWCYTEVPKWNPMNVCSYHLQEAGATPEQELVLRPGDGDRRARHGESGGQIPNEDFPERLSGGFPSSSTRECVSSPNLQDARLCGTLGRDLPRALRRDREIPALPLWRSGQLAWPHRTAA